MKINLTKSTIFFFLFIFNDLLADNNYFAQGIDLFQSKKFDNAKIKFEQDIVFNPKNEMSYLYLAKIFQKKDEIKQEKKISIRCYYLIPKMKRLYIIWPYLISKSQILNVRKN